MAAIDAPLHALWREALASALGPLSAYLTPQNYGVSVLGLGAAEENGEEAFRREIERRIDLGRAAMVAEIVEELGCELPHSYRHAVHYSEDRIDGVLVVPRLVRELAAGRMNRIPVLRAARFTETPEALLTSELLRVSSKIASTWAATSSAEGFYARELALKIRGLEAQQPWAALRSRPRPSLRSLGSSVKSRAIAGWTPLGGAFDRLAEVVLGTANRVTADPGPIAFLVSQDERHADRVFELVCVGWLLSSLKKMDPSGQVQVESLKGSNLPIFVGSRNGVRVRLHYQAGHYSVDARYAWLKTGNRLRAIPDYSLELDGPGWSHSMLMDAKNRVASSRSEIVYKLIGYQENLGIRPYLAIGIAPEYGARGSLNGVSYNDREVLVARLPLSRGRALTERILPVAIDRLIASRTT